MSTDRAPASAGLSAFAQSSARDDAPVEQSSPLEGRWPHQLSHEPMLRVSDVLTLVQREFPALSTSKLRFLDSQGLVSPQRTSSGYRQYSPADVERVRFVLRQQRDHYRPLTVISEHLEALDDGRMSEPVTLTPVEGAEREFLSSEELAEHVGCETDFIAQLEDARIMSQAVPGRFDRHTIPLVVAAHAYVQSGGDARALRTLRNAAQREAERARNLSAPARARRANAEADAAAEELAEAAISFFGACVRGEVNR